MQKAKLHKIIDQLRRPLCALVVLCIVFIYCMSSYAAEGGVSFADRYGLSDITIQDGLFAKSMYDRYSAEHDASVLSLYVNSQSFFGFNDVYRFMSSMLSNWNLNGGYYSNFVSQASNHVIPDSIVDQSVTYNLDGCYIVMTSAEDHWTYIVSDGYCCIIDGYIASESPFHVFTNWRGNSHVTTASQNGLYVYSMDDGVNWEYIQFTDMDVFFKSSNGDTGYTTFSVNDAGDFSFSDARSSYYNFNYLKTGGLIVAPGDPSGSDFGVEDSYHYLNFNVSHAFVSTGFSKFYHAMRFQWNESMIAHPEWYAIDTDTYFTYKDDHMSNAVQLHVTDTGPISIQNLGILQGSGGSAPEYACEQFPVGSFYDSNNNSLNYYISQTINRVTGTSSQYIDTSSWLTQVANLAANAAIDLTNKALGTQLPRDLIGTGYYKAINEYNSVIEVCKITSYVRVGRIKNPETMEIDYWSGDGIASYNFVDGSMSIDSSDNNVNLYPPESGLPDSVISSGSGTGGGVSYGGSNNAYAQGGQGGNASVVINPEQTPYKMDMIDYGRMKDIFDTVSMQFQNVQDNNGFIPVIQEAYEAMPPQLWQMFLIGFGVITATATVRFVRNK